MVGRKPHPKEFFTPEEKGLIVEAIREAERGTSGEIRVYLERRGRGEIMGRAKKVFRKLGMTRTKNRDGVLIYFSLSQHAFAVVGDEAIYAKAGDKFWKASAAGMEAHFTRGTFSGGLIQGIREIGQVLKRYFPREPGDVNELSNEVAE